MSERRSRLALPPGAALAAGIVAAALAGCGSSGSPGPRGGGSGSTNAGSSMAAAEKSVPVTVAARFPTSQRLAQPTRLVVTVRNAGRRTLPDVAVTICHTTCAANAPRGQGTTVAAFGYAVSAGPQLANPSRPAWIVTRPPGPRADACGDGDGGGGATTVNTNTWALGRLAPGRAARFVWHLTAARAGRYVVAWQVAGDLTGSVPVTLANGSGSGAPHGRLAVRVRSAPVQMRVTPAGRVVTARGSG